MEKNYIKLFIVILAFLGITFVIFYQFFIKGLYPIPTNYMLAWYEPWKSDYTKGQTITIQHKPVADDTFRYLYPLKKLGIDIAKKGEFPLWNPYNGAGMPLLATYQWGVFNPFNIFFFVLQTETAWAIYIIAQVFVLSFFMYLYCRKINISSKGAIFSTTIFVLSGFVIARLIFGNLVYPLATLPLILYLIEDHIGDQKSKKVLLLPLVIAFMLFSGHPHIMIYVVIFSFFYFLYRALNRALFFILLFSIGVGIASIQIIPTIELLTHSNLNQQSSKFIFDKFLLPPPHLISILIPNYFGNQATYNYWGAADFVETVAAIGLIPSFFAYLSLFEKKYLRRTHVLFFLSVVIISILATLNWLIPKIIYSIPIPIISTSPPSRIFGITSFAIAIMSGFGFDKWTLYATNFKRLIFQTAPFIIAIIAIVIGTFLFYKLEVSCNNEFIPNCRLIALRNTFLEVLVFVVALAFFFLYIKKAKNKIIKQCVPFGIIILVVLIGAYNSYKFLPFSKKESIFSIHPLIQAIKETTNYQRVLGLGSANIKTNFATHLRFYDPNFYDPLYNKRYAELTSFANAGTTANLLRSDIEIATDVNLSKEKQIRRNRLLNLLGISYLFFKKSEVPLTKNENVIWENENWYLLKNKDALPRIYLVNSFEVLTSPEELLERLFDKDFDPSKTVLLEESVGFVIPTEPGFAWRVEGSPSTSIGLKEIPRPDASGLGMTREKNQASIETYSENKVAIKTDTNKDSLLVLSDNYYPGWKAYVDDKEIKIYRANYTFRAVEAPVGKHTIRFSYEPNSFKVGLALSIASIVIYIGTISKLSFRTSFWI